jgi:hypothetical protein
VASETASATPPPPGSASESAAAAASSPSPSSAGMGGVTVASSAAAPLSVTSVAASNVPPSLLLLPPLSSAGMGGMTAVASAAAASAVSMTPSPAAEPARTAVSRPLRVLIAMKDAGQVHHHLWNLRFLCWISNRAIVLQRMVLKAMLGKDGHTCQVRWERERLSPRIACKNGCGLTFRVYGLTKPDSHGSHAPRSAPTCQTPPSS